MCRDMAKLGQGANQAIQAIEIEEVERSELCNFAEQQQYNPLRHNHGLEMDDYYGGPPMMMRMKGRPRMMRRM